MSRNYLVLAIVVVVVMASVGSGFALSYLSTTTSRNNTVAYEGITLDLQDNDHLSLNTNIPVVGPTTELTDNNLTHISGGCNLSYYLVVNCPAESSVYMQCWWLFSHTETWAVVDSITLSITVGGVTKQTVFTQPATSQTVQLGSIPSEALQLSSGTYSFSVSIQYRNIDLDLSGENQNFLNLSGSSITFSASTSAPVPNVVNPWTTVGSS